MPSGTTITNASSASLSECPIAVNSSGLTAAWYVWDMPMSPCTKWLMNSQYWVSTGLSVPYW